MELHSILSVWDWISLLIFLLSYFGYPYFYLFMQKYTSQQLRVHIYENLRREACERFQKDRTLPNGTLQTYSRILTTLATASFLALGGGLSLFLSSEQTQELLSFSLVNRVDSIRGIRFRLLIFILLCGVAFLQFIWGFKALYTLTYALEAGEEEMAFDYFSYMDTDLNRGIRTLYYLSILFLWFFGPEFLLIGTIGLTYILYRYDFLKTKY